MFNDWPRITGFMKASCCSFVGAGVILLFCLSLRSSVALFFETESFYVAQDRLKCVILLL